MEYFNPIHGDDVIKFIINNTSIYDTDIRVERIQKKVKLKVNIKILKHSRDEIF